MEVKAGVYSFTSNTGRLWHHHDLKLIQFSEKVWRQGPRGGVKTIKDRSAGYYSVGYVTKDSEEMKKFMWAKLQAQHVK